MRLREGVGLLSCSLKECFYLSIIGKLYIFIAELRSISPSYSVLETESDDTSQTTQFRAFGLEYRADMNTRVGHTSIFQTWSTRYTIIRSGGPTFVPSSCWLLAAIC